MRWPALVVSAAVLLMVGVAASSGEPQQEGDLKKTLPDAEGIKKSTRKLSKEAREKVEKALGAKLDDKEIPTIWEARATVPSANPNEKTRVFYVTLTAKGAKGDIKLGVAVATEDSVVAAVKLLENKDDKAVESKAFWAQFEGFKYTPAVEKPVSALEEARKKAKEGADADAKELANLFDLTERMHGVQTDYDTIEAKLEKEDDEIVEPATRMQTAFSAIEKLVPAFKSFLQQGQIDRFVNAMKASQKDAGRLIDAVKAKKWSDARNVMSSLGNEQCNKCHAWSRMRFSDRRIVLGIGNGYFVIGHEIVAPPEGPRDSLQAVATAVRKAVLIVTQAK